ncbi:MAG: DMT family transporter [Geminicoccaceae bacterium]
MEPSPHSPLASSPSSDIPVAVSSVLLGSLCLVGMTTTTKLLTETYPIAMVVWGRYAFHFAILAVIMAPRMAAVMRAPRRDIQVLRSSLMLVATVLNVIALHHLQLAEVSAIMFLTPLMVTALSTPLLGEDVGPRRWLAVLVGFAGALIIIRPGLGVVHAASLVALGCALAYALYQLATRKVHGIADPWMSLFYTSIVGTVASSLLVPIWWQPPDIWGWLGMAASGAFGAAGHLGLIIGLSRAAASRITPFTYTQLLWAIIAGWLVFGDWPDVGTLVGGLIIVASGLYVFRREVHLSGAN